MTHIESFGIGNVLTILAIIIATLAIIPPLVFFKRQYSLQFKLTIKDIILQIIEQTAQEVKINSKETTTKIIRENNNHILLILGSYDKRYLNKECKKFYIELVEHFKNQDKNSSHTIIQWQQEILTISESYFIKK